MYEIDFDAQRMILRIRLEGFWTLATVTGFATALLARGTWARARHGRFAILADARKMPVQSAEVARVLETITARSIAISDAPYAVVAISPLGKMQVDRVVKGDNCRSFLDLAEAEAWLDATWARPRAA